MDRIDEPHVEIAHVRPQQRGQQHGKNNENAPHGGSSLFGLMVARPLFPDPLSQSECLQFFNQGRSQDKREDKRGQGRVNHAKAQIPEHVENCDVRVQRV